MIRRVDQVSGRVDTLEEVQKRDVQNLLQQMRYVSSIMIMPKVILLTDYTGR